MKAIVLISSIFYILGLKISTKIDFIKKSNPVDTIISNKITPGKTGNTFYFDQQKKLDANPDSLKSEINTKETDMPAQ